MKSQHLPLHSTIVTRAILTGWSVLMFLCAKLFGRRWGPAGKPEGHSDAPLPDAAEIAAPKPAALLPLVISLLFGGANRRPSRHKSLARSALSAPYGAFALLMLLCGMSAKVSAANETFASGAFIVNMGVTPQTVGNGLKPYGMVYDLVKNYNVPVRWVINPSKPKDGIDFSHNGIDYKGGPFIIPVEYRSAAVNARITYWQGQGVVGATSVSAITVPVFQTIEAAPRWTLDAQNGAIAQQFLVNAGIPNTAYDYLNPQLLSACNDLFVMPHADPKWSTHSNLYNWNLTYKGGIWAGCHAVSALEDTYNPANPSQQMNFLSTTNGTNGPLNGTNYFENALVLWGNHGNASIPYNIAYPNDPVMQFMGKTDGAHLNGSEQVYLPRLGAAWRSSTKIGVWDPSQADVPSKSLGEAAIIAYGPGLGDPARGKICYEAGHDISKAGSAESVAAQRAFFNWSYWAAKDKALSVTVTGIPAVLNGGTGYPVAATVTSSIPSGPYTYQWMSTCGGTFANPSAASTTFTPPVVVNNTPCIVTCKVTDACGRTAFYTTTVTVISGPRPPVALDDSGTLSIDCSTTGASITLSVLTNDSDPDGDPLTITGVTGNNGTWTYNAMAGTVTYVPADNFTGTATATYTVCAVTPDCDNATITVTVGTADGQGCFPGQTSALTSAVSASAAPAPVSVGNASFALGDPDYDATDVNTYAVLNNAGDILVLDFGSIITSGDSVRVFFAAGSASSITMSVEYSTNNVGYTTVTGPFTTNTDDPAEEAVFALPVGGVRYVRLKRTAGSADLRVDAAQVETWDCVSALPIAGADMATTPEDIPVIINVLDNDDSPLGSPLTVTGITSNPSIGKVSISADGQTITYLNNNDVSGTDMFTYQVCDDDGFCSVATVTVNVTDDACPANQYKPLGTGSPTTVTLNPTHDAELDRQSATSNDNNADLEIGKKPNKQKRGVFTFDLSGIPASATVQTATFSINRTGGDNNTLSMSVYRLTQAYNEAQTTWNDRITATPWTTAGGTFDATIWATTSVNNTNGFKNFNLQTLTQNWVNGTYANNGLIVKQTNESSVDKKHKFATSEAGAGDRPKLVVTYVTPLPCVATTNRAPLANLDVATTPSSTAIKIGVKGNDSDADGNALTINSIVGAVTGGAAVIMGDSIQFTPTNTFNGIATFLYRISDGTLFDTARVNITVTNTAPVAVNDSPAAFNSNTVNNNFAVQSNDSDPDGPNPMTTEIIDGPDNGSASVSGINILYTPQTNFYGKDTITYRICEPVDPNSCDAPLCDTAFVFIVVNNRPPVTTPDVAVTNGCQAIQIFVLSNDSDPEGQPIGLTITTVSVPANGTATIDPGGQSITYVPSFTASGPVAITYTVCDNATPTPGCTVGNVTVTVNSMNPAVNNPPVAGNDLAEDITRAQVAFVPVLGNDSDPEGTSLTLSLPAPNLMPPASGTVALFGSNKVQFTPAPNFLGMATFTYRVCDQSPPVGPGCTPLAAQCTNATVTVNVVNQPPNAVDDYASTATNVPKNIFPLVNDSEPDGDAIILQAGGATAQGGTMVLNNNGTPGDPTDDYYVYTPPLNFTGVDQFTYQICDDIVPPLCATATIYITVEAPIDLELTKTFTPNTSLSIGQTVTFTLTLTNNSATAATGVTVLDLLSGSYDYQSSSGTGTYDPAFGIWAIGNVAGNATVSINITAEILNYTAFLNLAQVYTADQTDSDSQPGNMGVMPAEDDEDSVLPACAPPATPAAIIRQ